MKREIREWLGDIVIALDDDRTAAGQDLPHQSGAGRDAANGQTFCFEVVGGDEATGSVDVCPDQADGSGVGVKEGDGAGDDALQERLQIE
ncbi:MAG: hypothetical protein K0S78_1413, partial [Thermomicrobiales bacterium]|nr:hypothetical protein [Thermomicrobiales bacterium]